MMKLTFKLQYDARDPSETLRTLGIYRSKDNPDTLIFVAARNRPKPGCCYNAVVLKKQSLQETIEVDKDYKVEYCVIMNQSSSADSSSSNINYQLDTKPQSLTYKSINEIAHRLGENLTKSSLSLEEEDIILAKADRDNKDREEDFKRKHPEMFTSDRTSTQPNSQKGLLSHSIFAGTVFVGAAAAAALMYCTYGSNQ